MKNRLKLSRIIALTAVIGISLIGCGKENDTGKASDGKTAAFFKMFSSGTYHMKAKMTAGGMATTMETFIKGDNMATLVEVAGQSTRMVFKDKKMYTINDSLKTVMAIPAMGALSDNPVKTDGMKPTGSGTAKFDGKDLPYEEYSDAEGNKVQFFLDGNKLAGIRNVLKGGQTADITILVLDQNVPANMFDIPSDYKQVGAF